MAMLPPCPVLHLEIRRRTAADSPLTHGAVMTPSKPKHITTIGSIRLTIFGGSGSKRQEANYFSLERRQDGQEESWYPAAGFRIAELNALGQAIQAARQFLTDGKTVDGKSPASKDAADDTAPTPSAAQAPASQTTEEPPFEPTGVTVPVPSGAVTLRPARPRSDRSRSRPKPKPTRRPTVAKGRVRTR